jgi:uncharacterized protein YdaU (DUF1376 family)
VSKQRPDIWMPLYIGDYLADTQHLSAEQSGAYLHLLMHSWKVGPLPADLEALRRIARVEKDAWSIAWTALVSFFKPSDDGGLIQPRLEVERAAWGAKKAESVAKARDAANKRWQQARETDASGNPPSNAQAMLERCPSPSPSPLKTNTSPCGASSDDQDASRNTRPKRKHSAEDVERVYQAYPLKKAPAPAKQAIRKAFDRLSAKGETDPLALLILRIEAMKAARDRDEAAGRFVPALKYPATWFNSECYDEPGLEPVKNCTSPDGQPCTEAELRAQTGWTVMRGVA